MEQTPRFQLPFIMPGQAQKELHHNEALILIDLGLHAAVEGTRGDPPAVPEAGEAWLVAPAATGDGPEKHIFLPAGPAMDGASFRHGRVCARGAKRGATGFIMTAPDGATTPLSRLSPSKAARWSAPASNPSQPLLAER